MKKKVSISTTVTLVLLAVALTVSLTMLLAMRYFNSQLQSVSKRQAMYSHIHDVDNVVRAYYPHIDEELLRKSVAQGYVEGLGDPYAAYFDPAAYTAEQMRASGEAKNTGVVLGLDGANQVIISQVYVGSSAEALGAKVGDVVTAIDNVPVESKSISDLQAQLDAATEDGTKITVEVRRGEANVAFPLEVRTYEVQSVQQMLLGNMGYIKITAFNANTAAQFKDAYAALVDYTSEEGKPIAGLVFDLRNNVGGDPGAVQEMLSYILPLGAYGTTTDTKGNVTRLSAKGSKTMTLPSVTLINSKTAGEAEFFTGVLQEFGLTTVLGQISAGKAKYQQFFVLEQDYSALKLTVGEYNLMRGGSWEGVGIIPYEEAVLPPEQEALGVLLTPHDDAVVKAAVAKLESMIDQPDQPDDPVDVPSDDLPDEPLPEEDTPAEGEDTSAEDGDA